MKYVIQPFSPILFPLLFVAIFVHSTPAYAQFTLPGFSADLTLNTAPEYPSPGESVRLSVRSVLLDLSASEITWYVNDVIAASGTGVSELTVTAGPLGSETRIRAEIGGQNTGTFVAGALRPTEVDLLWEGDSYVPPFYRGRALPTAGGGVRLYTIPRFQRPGSASLVSTDDLIYTWRKNNRIIQSASGRGKNIALLEGPVLFGSDTFSVETRTTDGELRGFASVRISSIEPMLVLYENHPVFGILYHRALPAATRAAQAGLASETSIPEVEATLSAVPYFAPVQNPDGDLLLYKWLVNNAVIENSLTRPSSITINAEGADGRARIELELTHATNFFLSARRAWTLTLAGSKNAGVSDPFQPFNQ